MPWLKKCTTFMLLPLLSMHTHVTKKCGDFCFFKNFYWLRRDHSTWKEFCSDFLSKLPWDSRYCLPQKIRALKTLGENWPSLNLQLSKIHVVSDTDAPNTVEFRATHEHRDLVCWNWFLLPTTQTLTLFLGRISCSAQLMSANYVTLDWRWKVFWAILSS